MKKANKAKADCVQLLSPALKKAFTLFLSILLLAGSCAKTGESSASDVVPPSAGTAGKSAESPAATERGAVLLMGNSWVSGVPGFEANGFSALTGEYRLDGLAAGDGKDAGEGEFSVYITREILYFSGEWKSSRTGNITVFQRSGEEGFIAAVVLEKNQENIWTVIFQFPSGTEQGGLVPDVFNSMLRSWVNKFQYFLSQARSTAEISLPAVVVF